MIISLEFFIIWVISVLIAFGFMLYGSWTDNYNSDRNLGIGLSILGLNVFISLIYVYFIK